MKDLTNLRKIAENATPGEWEHWNPSVGESHIAIANKVAWRSLRSATQFADDEKIPHWADAHHIATFDPPTVLALLTRLEQAEQAVERVRTLTNELSWSPNNVAIVQRYRDALDGDGRG